MTDRLTRTAACTPLGSIASAKDLFQRVIEFSQKMKKNVDYEPEAGKQRSSIKSV